MIARTFHLHLFAACVLFANLGFGSVGWAQVGVGNSIASNIQAQCTGQTPLHVAVPHWRPQVTALSESLLEQLWLDGTSNPRTACGLFDGRRDGGIRFLDGTVQNSRDLTPASLSGVVNQPEFHLIGLVTGDRGNDARSIWRLDNSGLVQTLDITRNWLGRWYIHRVAITRNDDAPQLPDRFCTRDELVPLW